jgi:hypothetical protein
MGHAGSVKRDEWLMRERSSWNVGGPGGVFELSWSVVGRALTARGCCAPATGPSCTRRPCPASVGGEPCGFRWADVDLDAGCCGCDRPSPRPSPPWTGSGPRSPHGRPRDGEVAPDGVPRPRRGRGTALASESHERERLPMVAGLTDDGLVFHHHDGSPWSPGTISQAFHPPVPSSGLPRLRLHDLRHVPPGQQPDAVAAVAALVRGWGRRSALEPRPPARRGAFPQVTRVGPGGIEPPTEGL